MRLLGWLVVIGLAAAAPAAAQPHRPAMVAGERTRAEAARGYQGRDRGGEQTERFSRRVRIGRDGRLSISNISGDITVTGGGGEEVSIEAIKRVRGDQRQLGDVDIVVEEHAGRVEVRADYNRNQRGRTNNVSVDFTITLPATASIDTKSIAGAVKVTGVRGAVRAESVSGNITTSDTPRVETAKSVSGNVTLSGIALDGDLSASSVSGTVNAKGVKAHALDLGSVSGDVVVTDVTCERLHAKSVSGGFEYSGSIAKGGVYDVNVHSGTVRFVLANATGFELTAHTFSGSIRSDLPLTIGGDRDRDGDGRRRGVSNRSMHATYGDGSATLTLRTFSGDIIIAKR